MSQEPLTSLQALRADIDHWIEAMLLTRELSGSIPREELEKWRDSIDAIRSSPSRRAAELVKSLQGDAQRVFDEYWLANYPVGCVISNPNWHAPRIFRAAVYAIDSALLRKAKDGTA